MTELIWDGKYKEGKKTAPVRIALPFQTIETINESTADRKRTMDMFAQQAKQENAWRNRLIWGDKKYVLPGLLPEFSGKVNLIYIDPPFNVGSDFSFTATISSSPEGEGDEGGEASFVKQPGIIEQKAYRDTWGKGLDSYLQWFYETALLLRELLADDGSIYVHLDWHVGHYAKCVLDEVFGYENFRNDIVWKRTSAHNDPNKYGINNDSIFFYSKSQNYKFYPVFVPYEQEQIDSLYNRKDNFGSYASTDMTGAGTTKGESSVTWRNFSPTKKGRHWALPIWLIEKRRGVDKTRKMSMVEKLDYLLENSLVEFTKNGTPRFKRYFSEMEGAPAQQVWADIYAVASQAKEKMGYATQKPEALLERIIKASSNEGDLVLDCFCGSGTTAATAEKLNRRWITCDLGRFAIHTARKRFLEIENVKPFVVQNLGKYERQQWKMSEAGFTGLKDLQNPNHSEIQKVQMQTEKNYKNFICDLYHAQPLEGYSWLHGAKAGRMVHIGSVEAPITVEDIKQSIKEFWKLAGKEKSAAINGIDFLGWDFAFDVNETAAQFAKSNKVEVRFKKIPREVLEKKAVDQSDIKFYELASLKLKVKNEKLKTTVTLDNFIIPPDDIPEEVREHITHWSQWIDYWAVDWNYREDTFHNQWQSYRSKQNPKMELSAAHLYEAKGKYTVLVKVIDILGNDTTKAIDVELK